MGHANIVVKTDIYSGYDYVGQVSVQLPSPPRKVAEDLEKVRQVFEDNLADCDLTKVIFTTITAQGRTVFAHRVDSFEFDTMINKTNFQFKARVTIQEGNLQAKKEHMQHQKDLQHRLQQVHSHLFDDDSSES